VEEGAVGAGTGTICYGWKGGIGTSSRRVQDYTLGVIVQTNFGGNLVVDGVPLWKTLGHAAFPLPSQRASQGDADGSCMIVIATDAPLSPRDLQRLAARGVFALGRTGSSYSHGSGDFAIAFSTAADARVKFGETAPRAKALLPSEAISPLFQAALEATEEAVYNSMLRAQTMTGNGRTIEALPIAPLVSLLEQQRR
jgi:D-aminopeptidase